MPKVYILTIRDNSDFGAVRHESAHPDEYRAAEFAKDVALPAVQSRTDAEWHSSLDTTIRSVPFHQ